MKKIFALILAVVLIASLSATVFAADNTINYSSSSQTSGVDVSYDVQPNFTVTIPGSVSLGGTVTVSTDKVVVEYGKTVNVKLTGTSDTGNAFKLKTPEGAEITYTVMNGDDVVNVGTTVLSVTPESDITSTQLRFIAPTSITYAGKYTGTVTFTIVVE